MEATQGLQEAMGEEQRQGLTMLYNEKKSPPRNHEALLACRPASFVLDDESVPELLQLVGSLQKAQEVSSWLTHAS
jgi:hypothetical protein